MIKVRSIKFVDTNKLAEDVSAHISKGIISFALPVQRGYVWNKKSKSGFILNMIEGGPTFPIYVNKVDGIDYVIDGQQRTRTVNSFINNEFALSVLPPVETANGEMCDISGKKFDEIPDEFKDAIKRYNFGYNFGENLTDDQVKTVFIRLNSGKPLSSIEIIKAQSISVNDIDNLAKHSVFETIIGGKRVQKSQNANLIMKIYIALYEDDKSFTNSSIKEVMTSNVISQDQIAHIRKCLDILEVFYNDCLEENSDISKKLIKVLRGQIHFVSTVYVISKALSLNVFDMKLFSEWIKHFYNTEAGVLSISDDYNEHTRKRPNSKAFVQFRLNIVQEDFLNFFSNKKGVVVNV